MQEFHGKPDREPTIIIVAPPSAVVRVVRRPANQAVVAFTSADEFEAWSEKHRDETLSIRREVAAALEEIGCAGTALPRRLRLLIEALADRPSTPKLRELEQQWPSRRTFYRTWSTWIAEPPSAFLRRVRALHAGRLIKAGMTRKKAAVAAGFSSVDQMRRAMRR